MNITSWHVEVEGENGGYPVKKSVTYRGNENLVIKCDYEKEANETTVIRFPRYVMDKFLEMIE